MAMDCAVIRERRIPASMDAPVTPSFISRRSLFWLAWVLLAISLLLPAPAGSFVNGASGISAFYVFGKAVVWSEAAPGSAGDLGLFRAAMLTLALLSNIAFLFTAYMRRVRSVSVAWKAILLVSLVPDACIAFLIPEFARLPAYWIWLASMAALALAYVVFPGEGTTEGAQPRKRAAALDRGEVPPIYWLVLGFTAFWLAVSAGSRAYPQQDTTGSINAALTSYVTDRAHVLADGGDARLAEALDKFEKETSNQIVVAIYQRAPAGSIEEFTIRIADRSRLGRKGIDNGAILFVFMDERVARLEVGYGLEGTLTDVDAHRVLEEHLAPAFAKGLYFYGLDATLGTIFNLVEDAYKQDRMPGRLTVWWRQVKVELPKALRNLWPAVSNLGLGGRVGVSIAGPLILMILWSVLGQWIRLAGDVAQGARNLRAHRPFTSGMEKVDIGELWDSLKFTVWVLVGIFPAAGLVVVALGGAFGGAGSLVHW
ncbi:MAG: TPM domain-containing protein [Casimicrobiaceae bacterium]